MEITGRIILTLPVVNGTSAKGAWQKQDFVIETIETYPKKVCMNLWGDKIAELNNYKIGDTVKASLNIESKEYNGKWYTEIRAWKLEAAVGGAAPANPTPRPNNTENFGGDVATFEGDNSSGAADDLPF
ncbi:MAG: DUF3127 domain-containing protein [Bacteroidia bacterium]|nr:DUF3127 domain-containing protein [Bacteroidia bacterium]